MRIHIFHHPSSELLKGLLQLDRIEEYLMALSPEVSSALDGVRNLNSIVPSIDAGMKALQAQIADLKNQIANQSPSLSDEDKAALLEMVTDTSGMISTLQADIPANTPPQSPPGGQPAPGTSPAS